MFDYISGIVEYLNEDNIVIDVGGIGYKIRTSLNTIFSIKKGFDIRIYTQLIIREDDVSIYGFSTRSELAMFKMLLSISGVGPKAALSLLSNSKVSELASAIVSNDTRLLVAAPGIGKKTAERIILELKDKIKTEDIIGGNTTTVEKPSSEMSEVIEVLLSLGYNYSEASVAVSSLPDKTKKVESLLKEALQFLSSRK